MVGVWFHWPVSFQCNAKALHAINMINRIYRILIKNISFFRPVLYIPKILPLVHLNVENTSFEIEKKNFYKIFFHIKIKTNILNSNAKQQCTLKSVSHPISILDQYLPSGPRTSGCYWSLWLIWDVIQIFSCIALYISHRFVDIRNSNWLNELYSSQAKCTSNSNASSE